MTRVKGRENGIADFNFFTAEIMYEILYLIDIIL